MPGSRGERAESPADCCRPAAPDPRIARYFDRKVAGRLAGGDTFGLGPVSRRLLAELDDVHETRPSMLELGCGTGALTLALLDGGAARATGIDLSATSVDVATRRAAAQGLAGRSTFRVGDAATVTLEPHDWVVLDKVLCCYRELDAILANSIRAAQHRYVIVVPDSRGLRGLLNRIWVWLENATNAVRGRPCPGYVHDIRVIERRLRDAGFERVRSTTARLWYFATFQSGDGDQLRSGMPPAEASPSIRRSRPGPRITVAERTRQAPIRRRHTCQRTAS